MLLLFIPFIQSVTFTPNTILILNKTKHTLLVGMTSDKIKDRTEMILNGSATYIPFSIKLP